MCYYATTDYLCGDWKWGNMMLRCPRQHRIGETCGAKLVHHESITKSATICKICEEIQTKQRRLVKTRDNISRWSREPDKFSASLEKAQREGRELEDKVKDLHLRRPSIATSLNGATRSTAGGRGGSGSGGSGAAPAAPATLPPLTSMSVQPGSTYEYTSPQGLGRRTEAGSYGTPRNGALPVVNGAQAVGLGADQTGVQYANFMAPGTNIAIDGQRGQYMTAAHVRR